MAAIRYELRREHPEAGLIDELAGQHPRIGLSGLLRRRGLRAWPGRVPAKAAVEGFRWGLLDAWSPRWWPQGVEVLSPDGDELLVVSWFAQKKGRGPHRGARITVVDRRRRGRPRYHHVLLVDPVRDGDRVRLRAVDIHAGGLALVGTRLYAAATFGGLRVFDLDDILRLRGPALFGYRCVLPQSGHERLHGGRGDGRLRFSFVSLERGDSGDHLIVGEFGTQRTGRRLGRVPIRTIEADGPTEIVELHEPSIPRMQGAAVTAGTWYVSASNGVRRGDLWVGSGSSWTRHRGVLPAGPEDLAATPDGRRLWSLCEYPRRRWVYALDTARWRDAEREPDPEPDAASGGTAADAAAARSRRPRSSTPTSRRRRRPAA